MKEKKPFLKLDERNRQIALQIIAVMYFLTIMAMHGVSIYRQFALGQDIHDFEDFAIIMTVNSIFLICALLYFGALPIQKLRIKTVLAVYGVILVAGTVFTYIKYNVAQSPGLTPSQMLGKVGIIFCVTGLIVLFFVLFSILGKKRAERELEDE